MNILKEQVKIIKLIKIIFLKKSTFDSNLTVGLEYNFTDKFSLGLDLGYRYTSKVKIHEIKLDYSRMIY